MHNHWRSILLLICLTVLFSSSSCVFAQEKKEIKTFVCKNQAEVEFIGFEKIVGAVESNGCRNGNVGFGRSYNFHE
jgi:hypothetical protein